MARSFLVEVRLDLASKEASSFFSLVSDHIKVFSSYDKEDPHHNDDPSEVPSQVIHSCNGTNIANWRTVIFSLPVRYTVRILDVSLQDTEESLRRYKGESRCMPLKASTLFSSLQSYCKLYINLSLMRLLCSISYHL